VFFWYNFKRGKTVVIEFQNMVKESLYPLLYNPLRLALKSPETVCGGVLMCFHF
jgi:hypothetical protein